MVRRHEHGDHKAGGVFATTILPSFINYKFACVTISTTKCPLGGAAIRVEAPLREVNQELKFQLIDQLLNEEIRLSSNS